MDKLLSGLKTEVVYWGSDSGDGLDGNTLIPMELGGTMLDPPKPAVSVMDLGKMLLHCAKEGDTSKVHELMSRGAPFSTDWLGTSPLHMAAAGNHIDTCEVLLRAGISKDARTKVDRTALHFAVFEGHEQIVDLLLASKCEVDARDMLKMTPLHWAVVKRHKKIADSLLKQGADPSAISKFFKTPLSIAAESNQTDVLQELLAWKMRIGDPEQQSATDALINEMNMTVAQPTLDAQVFDDDDVQLPNGVEHKFMPSLSSMGSSSPGQMYSNVAPSHREINANGLYSTASAPRSIEENAPTLQMLKDHGISMLSDDIENTLLNSALQNGRKLVLSDAGKLILNDMKYKKIVTTPSDIAPLTTAVTPMIPLSAFSVKPKVSIPIPAKQIAANPGMKANKVIKILSANEFKQIYGRNVPPTLKKISPDAFSNAVRCHTLPRNNVTLPKVATSIPSHMYTAKDATGKPMMSYKLKFDTSSFQTATTTVPSVPNPKPKEIVRPMMKPIQFTSATITNQPKLSATVGANQRLVFTQSLSRAVATPSTSSNPNSVPFALARIKADSGILVTSQPAMIRPAAVHNIKTETMPVEPVIVHQPMVLSEIERQLLELKKQTEELRKQLELSQKQNDEYKVRLEKLEQEKHTEKGECATSENRFCNGML